MKKRSQEKLRVFVMLGMSIYLVVRAFALSLSGDTTTGVIMVALAAIMSHQVHESIARS